LTNKDINSLLAQQGCR